MGPTPLRALDLVRTLTDHGVDYVVIGGFAVIAHGSPRSTRDLDIVGRPAGAPPYQELLARAVPVTIGGLEVLVAGLDDLIAMKRAAGRPLDLQDIADLTESDA